jgi:hypothetical protein
MPKGFLPNADSALLHWCRNFAERIAIDPERLGISPALSADFAAKTEAYATAYQAAAEPGTRSRSLVMTKNDCRAALRAAARHLAQLVKGQADVSDAERVTLGLAPRTTGHAAPIARPAAAPSLSIVAVTGHRVRVQLFDPGSPRRGRPAGILGAVLFSHATPPSLSAGTPPADVRDWRLEGHTTRTTVTLSFPSDLPPGTEIQLTARWLNPRLQPGPAARAVTTHLGGGCSLDTSLRVAA